MSGSILTTGLGSFGSPSLILTLGLGSSATYDTLLEAVVATLKAGLVTPGDLTGVYDRVPPRSVPPYATCLEIGISRDWTNTAGGYVDQGQVQVQVYAATKKACRTLADSAAGLLNDAALTFDEGSLMVLRQSGRFAEIDPDRGPDGKPLHVETRTFDYKLSSGLY